MEHHTPGLISIGDRMSIVMQSTNLWSSSVLRLGGKLSLSLSRSLALCLCFLHHPPLSFLQRSQGIVPFLQCSLSVFHFSSESSRCAWHTFNFKNWKMLQSWLEYMHAISFSNERNRLKFWEISLFSFCRRARSPIPLSHLYIKYEATTSSWLA